MTRRRKNMQRTDEASQTSDLLDGRFALGLTIGMSLSVVAMLIFGGYGFDLSRAELLSTAPAVATAAIAIVSAILALVALGEQRRMRQAGTDPVLIAHLGQRSDQPMLITFNISNVGAGAAMNVKLSVERPTLEFDSSSVLTDIFSPHHTIRVILQNNSISYDFGVGHQLVGENQFPPFQVLLEYEDIEGSKYSSGHEIDTRELEKRSAATPPLTGIERHLKSLSDAFSSSASGHKPLNILTQTKKESEAEKSAAYEKFKSRQRDQ